MITRSHPQAEVTRQRRQKVRDTRDLIVAAAVLAAALSLLAFAIKSTAQATCASGECCFSTECE